MTIHVSIKSIVKRFLVYIFPILYSGIIYSQQNAEDLFFTNDTILLKDIRLKPEVWEAIRAGNLINSSSSHDKTPLKSEGLLPIEIDFRQYITISDEEERKIDFEKMPPSVFKLYGPNIDYVPLNLKSFSLAGIENYKSNRPQPILITDPLMKGPASGGLIYIVSINNLIDYYILKKKSDY